MPPFVGLVTGFWCPSALYCWAAQPQGMKLEQTDRKLKAVAEDARSVDSLEFPSVSGFGGEAACASSLSAWSVSHVVWCQRVV